MIVSSPHKLFQYFIFMFTVSELAFYPVFPLRRKFLSERKLGIEKGIKSKCCLFGRKLEGNIVIWKKSEGNFRILIFFWWKIEWKYCSGLLARWKNLLRCENSLKITLKLLRNSGIWSRINAKYQSRFIASQKVQDSLVILFNIVQRRV